MIRMLDYQRGLPELEEELLDAFQRVLHSNELILGPETRAFECEFAEWAGANHCIAVTSGTMALYVALRALKVGPGDEVITVANTCPPTVAAIRMTGAEVAFVDVLADTLMIDPDEVEQAITERTRAILPVHLWGCAADMESLTSLAEAHDLYVVEDCAQAAGTRIRDRQVGTFGDIGCFSFYPSKNLGAYGDGGAVVTDDAELADRLKRIRMYGYEGSPVSMIEGCNARINEVQAAMLRIKLRRLDQWNERRRQNAKRYLEELESVRFPVGANEVVHANHQFVVRCDERSGMTRKLDAAGVQWGIHYETPVHRMPAYLDFARSLPVTETAAGEILSIPVHEFLTEEEVDQVIAAING